MPKRKSDDPIDEIHLQHLVDEWFEAQHNLLGASEVLAAASKNQEFLIDDCIPRSGITLAVGPPGQGKSWIAYTMAMAVLRGQDWLGHPTNGNGRPVLILNFDNPLNLLGRRFQQLGLQPGDNLHTHSPDIGGTALMLPEYTELAIGVVERLRPAMVLIDSFRQAHTEDENDSQVMADVMRIFKRMAWNGTAVVVLHHVTKGGSEGRGSGEILGSSEAAFSVTQSRDTDQITMHWRKTRGWQQRLDRGRIYASLEDHPQPDGTTRVTLEPVEDIE